MGMQVGVLSAFGAGVLSFLSPCILPLVPPYLCFLAGTSLDELISKSYPAASSRALVRALAFVLGFSAVFVVLGASASWLGQFASEHMAVLTRVAGVVIVVLGLHMLGLFRLLPLMREARFEVAARPTNIFGAFLVGLAFGFGWTPCVGPVLTSILLLAGTDDTASRGAILLAAYGTGIGVPFLVAAAFTGSFLRSLKRIRAHLGLVEKVLGATLVGTGALIFFGLMSTLGGWLLEAVPALGWIG